jgi:endonuclease/exonuclease/phosphatase family metal-dependent hydrolase
MRVMTWNLFNGGQDAPDRGRLARIVDIVRRAQPHVAVFQEARDFHVGGQRLLHQLEEDLDMRGFLAVAASGYHLAAYVQRSRDVTYCEFDAEHFHHALLRLGVTLIDGSQMHVLGAHLHPRGSATRLAEAQRVVNLVPAADRTVVVGDLNSLDHHRDHTQLLAELPPEYRARYTLGGDDTVADTRVTQTLEAAGLVDLGYHLAEDGDTFPTGLDDLSREVAKMRLDYIYASEELAALAVDIRVITSPEIKRASDHYPVVADFDLA